jgi:DNA-binding CsgD family transcriptional regulator
MRLQMTPERVEQIQRLCFEGLRPAEIAEVTGISESSCRRFSKLVASGVPLSVVLEARERERVRRARLGPFTARQMEIAMNVLAAKS